MPISSGYNFTQGTGGVKPPVPAPPATKDGAAIVPSVQTGGQNAAAWLNAASGLVGSITGVFDAATDFRLSKDGVKPTAQTTGAGAGFQNPLTNTETVQTETSNSLYIFLGILALLAIIYFFKNS